MVASRPQSTHKAMTDIPPPLLCPELSLRHQTQSTPMGSIDHIFTYSWSFPPSYIYTILTENRSLTL